MVTILGDGTLVADDDPRLRAQTRRRSVAAYRWPIALGSLLAASVLFNVFFGSDDLADGHVPASDRNDHIAYILSSSATFVLTYLRNANTGTLTDLLRPDTLADMERGGRTSIHGHGAEDIASAGKMGMASQSTTRCVSTQYAITAYFCGDEVASNLEEGGTGSWHGLADLEALLAQRSAAAPPPPGGFSRLVLRLDTKMAVDVGQGHVWPVWYPHLWRLVDSNSNST